MEHNNLASIAYARPVIYAEGLFASCYLDHGEFVPEEGISHTDLWNILSGELVKTGSDLIEDYALKTKLSFLHSTKKNTYELDQFPHDAFYSSCNMDDENTPSGEKDQKLIDQDTVAILSDNQGSIPMLKMNKTDEENGFVKKPLPLTEEQKHQLKLREAYEKQVSWIMGDEGGEEFVSTETFERFTDALILLDVLKKFNVPSVVSFLARRDEPIALTFSKTKIGLDVLMFCLFQA